MEKKIELEEKKSLPIYEHKDKIIETIKNNIFCIITGETGSGKSTQIPQYVYDGLNKDDLLILDEHNIPKYDKMIYDIPENNKANEENENKSESTNKIRLVITQPRRVAAIQMAKRICYERNCKLTDEVGYTIRFEDCTTQKTMIKFVTDGILDKNLNNYDIVILDEAHERSLHTDVLFALVKQAVIRRKGKLRLIVTSATLNTQQFSEFFFNCPVIQVSGRCYDVAILHGSSQKERIVENSVKAAIRLHLHEGPGDILVFLTGFEECEQACKICYQKLEELIRQGKTVPAMIIIPLYGAQNTDEQARVFEKPPDNCRKLIFATNIAETSLTVDGVAFVIDCGYVKQKIYNPRTGIDTLQVVPISKVQAIQRTGRAGRTSVGKCFRLYTEQFFNNQMEKTTVPEILRVNLSSTVLTLKSMGIDDILNFDFIEIPDQEAIYHAMKNLYFLRALNKDGEITKLGLEMCKLPLEPTYSKALIVANFLSCIEDVSLLVSILSSESVWLNVNKNDIERRKLFEDIKIKFADQDSDHLTLINVYNEWKYNHYNEDWCKEHFIQFRALRQSKNIKDQILEYLNKINFKECEKFIEFKPENKYKKKDIHKNIRKALSQGFFMNSARHIPHGAEEGTYLNVSDGNMVKMDTNSSLNLHQNYPEWIIYTELGGFTANKAVMRMITKIKLTWIEKKLPLLKDIDLLRLRGKKYENKRKAEDDADTLLQNEQKREELERQIREKQEEERKVKLSNARERFLERKKFK